MGLPPKKVGYARVSTKDGRQQQHGTASQLEALKGEGCESVFEDIGESGAKFKRPEFLKMNALLRRGDTVVFYKLDRIGRSSVDVLQLLRDWNERGVKFKSIGEPMLDTTTPMGKILTAILAAFAEFERDIIIQRVHAGLNAARARNRKLGRKFLLSKEDEHNAAEMLSHDGLTIDQVARKFGVSNRTIYRMKRRGPDARTKDEARRMLGLVKAL